MRLLFLLALVCAVTAQLDPRFAENSCIVVGLDEAPNCDAPTFVNRSKPTFVDERQLFFVRLEDAVEFCPFNPVLIETIGTVYVHEAPVYPGTNDIIIHGVSVDGQRSTLVGLGNFDITQNGVSVTVNNLDFEGCLTKSPVFSCLGDQSLSLAGVAVRNYNSQRVLCQNASSPHTQFWLVDSLMRNTPLTGIWLNGVQEVTIVENLFIDCGINDVPCIRIVSPSNYPVVINNVHEYSTPSD